MILLGDLNGKELEGLGPELSRENLLTNGIVEI